MFDRIVAFDAGADEVLSYGGITEAAVMTQVFRARQKLKAMLDGEEREAEVYGLP